MASDSIAELPVTYDAANLVAAISKLPVMAAMIAVSDSCVVWDLAIQTMLAYHSGYVGISADRERLRDTFIRVPAALQFAKQQDLAGVIGVVGINV